MKLIPKILINTWLLYNLVVVLSYGLANINNLLQLNAYALGGFASVLTQIILFSWAIVKVSKS